MAIVSITYNKIHAERARNANKSQITIKNNVAITNVHFGNVSHTSQKAVVFDYTFSIVYEPEIGNINIEGCVVDILEEKEAQSIVDMWEKNKRVEKGITTKIVSVIIEKGYLKGINLSQDLGLPSPVPLPRVRMDGDVAQPEKEMQKAVQEKKDKSKDKKK